VTPARRSRLRAALLRFYRRHRRDLPWRRTRDPYAIWVSEIMLQQTQVATVEPRYRQFLAEFPDVATLARAPVERVCEAWAGLGYYSRARNLHAAARAVVAEHDGVLPRDAAGLVRLPGIGRYTAGAVASIAFDEPAPIVDGNVARVLARLHALTASPKSAAGSRRLWTWAAELVRGPQPGELNQALMELGALVCTPRSPQCPTCPVRRHCRAGRSGRAERFPPAAKRPRRALLAVAFLWHRSAAGVWLVRRPPTGLWAGLWELPSAHGPRARRELEERLGVPLAGPVARITHELTHRVVRARVFVPERAPRLRRSPTVRPRLRPLEAPLSALARRAIEEVSRLSLPGR
jgi:A/G-specific adenine glycosylase